MLYKFKSQATGELIMLEENAKHILTLWGKETQSPGILSPEQIPAAITALERAIAEEEAEQKRLTVQAKEAGEAPPKFAALGLRQRAHSMLDMLQRCAKEDAAISW